MDRTHYINHEDSDTGDSETYDIEGFGTEFYSLDEGTLRELLRDRHGLDVKPDDLVEVVGRSPEDNWGRLTELHLLDSHGIYIPQIFARDLKDEILEQQSERVREALTELRKENSQDDEWYWENWTTVEDGFEFVDGNSHRHTLYQNGDLWVIDQTEFEELTDTEQEEFWDHAN